MPATKCNHCDQTHRLPPRRNPIKFCLFHDPDNYVDKRLLAHDGLPADCPGCLGHGTIEQRPYGVRKGDYVMRCRECRAEYHWSER